MSVGSARRNGNDGYVLGLLLQVHGELGGRVGRRHAKEDVVGVRRMRMRGGYMRSMRMLLKSMVFVSERRRGGGRGGGMDVINGVWLALIGWRMISGMVDDVDVFRL